MALTPFDMEGVNRDLLAAGNPAKPDMQSILRRNAREIVIGVHEYVFLRMFVYTHKHEKERGD